MPCFCVIIVICKEVEWINFPHQEIKINWIDFCYHEIALEYRFYGQWTERTNIIASAYHHTILINFRNHETSLLMHY